MTKTKPLLIKRLLVSGVASLMICGFAETARSQTAEPAPSPTPNPAPSPAPAENPAPADNAPAASSTGGATVLPQTTVQAPKQAARRSKQKPRAIARQTAPAAPASAPLSPAEQAAAQVAAKNGAFDQARSNIFTQSGANSDTIGHGTIQNLPQGANQSVEQVLLQAPGVSQDSAASGLFHVRNDHANVQFRINGVLLPDGVTGFGSIFDTSFIGSMSLVTGALPAEYGLRTTGLIDITTRTDLFNNSGSVGVYGGSHGTITPSIEYGGTFGGTCPTNTSTSTLTYKAPASPSDCFAGVQYYFSGRYTQNTVGIENPTPAYNAIHDFTQQDKGFAYMSAIVDPTTRVSLIAGTSYNNFQIPNNPGQPTNPAVPSAFGVSNFNSAALNENQVEKTQFSVLSLQKSVDGFDGQLSYFTRYNELRFTPDPIGDLLINGVASDIGRISYTNGIAGDGSYKLNGSHTLRAGFSVSAEQATVENTSLVENLDPTGTFGVEPPIGITDNVSKLGWLAGVYVQDEWKLTSQLTMNYGLRFDQMEQFVSANQFSPRLSFTYKPFDNTTFHIGYARYFTPPVLVEAAPVNINAFNNTTAAVPTNQGSDPVLPERSHYFDAGADQIFKFGCGSDGKGCSSLDLGVDAYYKIAQDLIDNGQFGQALVLSAFNYARGYNEGIEFKAKYTSGNLQVYGNLAIAQQRASDPVSNQYLFGNTPLADLGGLTEFQYLQSHFVYTDHNQFVTASAGALYQFCGRAATSAEAFGDDGFSWCGVKLSGDMIYGSGLRDGDANIGTVSPYTQVNIGIQREFLLPNDPKPTTIRFDVVNLFDHIYEIRDGSGIGVFAPQFGPRRGFFLGISKKI